MKKTALSMMVLIASFAGSAQAADCVQPVFPSQSTSDEGARRVEKQVVQFRKCQAELASKQDAALTDRQNAQMEAGYAKWAAATRSYSNGQLAGSAVQSSAERDQSAHLASRHTPMRPVYGSERK
jgi:opacity protein-like surface antigen